MEVGLRTLEAPLSFRPTALVCGTYQIGGRALINIGDADGKVHVFCLQEGKLSLVEVLDLMSGCPVTYLKHFPLTGVSSDEIVCGDAGGGVTVYSRSKVVIRASLPHAITLLAVERQELGDYTLVAGDLRGNLACLFPEASWRVYLAECARISKRDGGEKGCAFGKAAVSLRHRNEFGGASQVLCVALEDRRLLFMSRGKVIDIKTCPSTITSMCTGRFIAGAKAGPLAEDEQLLAAGEDGVVYRLQGGSLVPFVVVGHHITKIEVLLGTLLDGFVCAGHWSGWKAFMRGKLVADQRMSDWVLDLQIYKEEHGQRLFAISSDSKLWTGILPFEN